MVSFYEGGQEGLIVAYPRSFLFGTLIVAMQRAAVASFIYTLFQVLLRKFNVADQIELRESLAIGVRYAPEPLAINPAVPSGDVSNPGTHIHLYHPSC
jgi:hypothetical protein